MLGQVQLVVTTQSDDCSGIHICLINTMWYLQAALSANAGSRLSCPLSLRTCLRL